MTNIRIERLTKQVANNILFQLYLFHFNLRNDKSILEQTVIQIRFLSIRHINQDLMFQLQHSMTMQADDLIMKIENMRIFSTKSSFSDKSCCCLSTRIASFMHSYFRLQISNPIWHVFICLSISPLRYSEDTFISY